MKFPSALIVSLFGNVALGVVTTLLWIRSTDGASTPASSPGTTQDLASNASSARSIAAAAPTDTTATGIPLRWSDTTTQLRRAGVASEIIARVVVEHVAQKWTPLEAEHERRYLDGSLDAKQLAALRDERAQEEERELRAALGEGYNAWDREHTVANMYLGGHVAAESEKDALYRAQKNWLRQLAELERAQRDGRLTEAALDDARTRAEREFKLQLAGIIGPEHVDGLIAEADPLIQVRRDFSALKLSESQINELAAAHQQWNAARNSMAAHLAETKAVDNAYAGDLSALDRVRDEKFRRILGDDTFALWQRAADDRYRALQTNSERWSLNRAQIDELYASIRAYDLTMATLQHQAQVREQSGERIDTVALNSSLDRYTQQTESALRMFLGDARFTAMAEQQLFNLRPATTESRDHGPK